MASAFLRVLLGSGLRRIAWAFLDTREESIMQEYAAKFYKSRAWESCRLAYLKQVGGLCEECLKQGRYTPGVIVHHKIQITPDNIGCPEITMDFSNLELLCRDCHAQMHSKYQRRFRVDDAGRVSPRGVF